MIVMIDNFDSFTFNIVDYYRGLGNTVKVFRNNEVGIEEIECLHPSHIILSPGPKDPNSAGITMEIITHFQRKVPIFGVCLGCQAIAQVYGAKIIIADKMYHGKTSIMTHESKGILQGVKSPMVQMRYHSLVIDESTLPDCLEITARSESGEIMAIRHKEYPIEAVQFHPESIASEQGEIIMSNVLKMNDDTSGKADLDNTSDAPAPYPVGAPKDLENEIIALLLAAKDLSKSQAELMMLLCSDNQISAARMALILTALRMKGESAEEIAGIASAARKRFVPFPVPTGLLHEQGKFVDIVGTGGDERNTFNISTASAIVAAGAGAKVLKHGNRAVSSKSGSADVLEALGITVDVEPEEMAEVLETSGMCFMFAPKYHPSMKYVAPVRKELKVRTVFNILGPLINPAEVSNIVLGVFDKKLMPIIADTLVLLNINHAMVIHSDRGADEITLDGTTYVIEIKNGKKHAYDLVPQELYPNLLSYSSEDINNYIEGGDAAYNAKLIEDTLKQELKNEIQKKIIESVLALNAGAALYVSGHAIDIQGGIEKAYASIHSGSALKVLENMRQ